MAKKKLSRDQKRKQKKRKKQQRKQKPGGGGSSGGGLVSNKITVSQPSKEQIAAAAAAYQAQEARIMQLFGAEDEEQIPNVDETSLQTFADHLHEQLQLPCLLAGIESIGYFGWEERFQFGYGSQTEYERLRKEIGSLKDEFLLEEFNPQIKSDGWTPDIVVKIKRTSDGKYFEIPLSELEAVDKDSDNAVLLNDFSVWKVNW